MGTRIYKKQTWDEWYYSAKAYYEENGDLLVPGRYKTAEGYSLGRWIERQRARYNGLLANPIRKDEQAALEKIGMVWKLESRLAWEHWISMAEDYYRKYGNLEVHTDYMVDGYRFGYWLKAQRKKCKAGKLTKRQIQDLEKCGMVWSFGERTDWYSWYTLAEHYYQSYGNLLIPLNYKTENGDKLGVWIFIQRERRSKINGRKPLDAGQILALDKISMVWKLDCVREEKWEAMYQWVAEYKRENHRLPLRPLIKAPDGRSMGNWIAVQRTALGRGMMKQDRTERLSMLEIYPFRYGQQKRS